MQQHISDLIIHLDETLNPEEISQLEQQIPDENGIISACMSKKDKHLLMVSYDSEQLRSNDVLGCITSRGYHGELIGM